MASVHLPILPSVRGSIQSDGRRKRIVPADVHGRFDRARKVVFALLIALWVLLPWVHVGGAPAVFLDVDARRFFLFGLTLNAQDTWLLFFLLSGAGFSLVYITALAGRAWCGWACPQTVFLEGVYRRIERWIDGPRDKHLRREARPMTAGRALRAVVKHAAFVAVSVVIAHIILAYFVSLPRAFAMVRASPARHVEAFVWVTSITALLYGNFAWFREQLCVVLCPYGRLQSVLLDDDSLVVGYDVKRGEPRGKKGTEGAGDCVDCKRCVVVCPTGIDIREGLQLDCVACTACIDACDEVMDRLERPRGLVRYDSPNGLAGKPRRVFRARIVLYTVMLALGGVVAGVAFAGRTDFEAKVTRLPGAPYTMEQGTLRNAFDLHLVNKRRDSATFVVTVVVPPGAQAIVPMPRLVVDSLSHTHAPLFVTIPQGDFRGDGVVQVRILREGTSDSVTVSAPLLGAAR